MTRLSTTHLKVFLPAAAMLSFAMLAGCGHDMEQRAATGAATGLVVAGPVGAAVGAGAGAVIDKTDPNSPSNN